MLLETLAGHFAWLQEAHPRKANTQTVKRCKRMVLTSLRQNHPHRRLAA
jgi:hypothetical protein